MILFQRSTTTMLTSVIIAAVVTIILCFYFWKWIKNYRILVNLPGPPRGGVLIGNLNYIQTTPDKIFERLRKCREKFYPIYKLFAVHKISANILSPEDCELIMSNPAHNQKGQIYNVLHSWLQDGLLTSFGSKWQTRRKILTPAFHFNILQNFVGVFNEEVEKLVEILKKESQKSGEVDVSTHIGQYTLKTITETAMGTKLQFNTQDELDYKKAIYDVGQILIYRILHPWCIQYYGNILSPWFFKERRVVKTLHTFTKKLIGTREKTFKEIELPTEENEVYRGRKRLAMLDLLLSAKIKDNLIDNTGIQEEVDTFTFEGHDTTSVAISFLLMLLACHKDVQDLIVQEMTEILGDIRTKPTFADLQNMKYLERCIKESLRLYPSVPLISRTLGEDLVTHSGYVLPKETVTILHIYDVHHNPHIYPDPEKFDPDRFLPDNCQNRHPYAYIPFSAGSRNCIGQRFAMLELKATVCAILGSFVLEPVDTPETVALVVDIVLRSQKGIKVKFVQRSIC